jgi:hypothetical protein
VFESKWIARYHLKRALVLNTNCPTDLAIALVATLNRTDLRLVSLDPNLAEPVRAQAASLLHVVV